MNWENNWASPSTRVDEFVERTFRLFSTRPAPPRIFPGMREVVLELADKTKIGILTGNTFQVVDRFLETNDLSAAIDVVIERGCAGKPLDETGADRIAAWTVCKEKIIWWAMQSVMSRWRVRVR